MDFMLTSAMQNTNPFCSTDRIECIFYLKSLNSNNNTDNSNINNDIQKKSLSIFLSRIRNDEVMLAPLSYILKLCI